MKQIGDSCLTLSVARRAVAFTPYEIDALSMFGRLSLSLMARYHALRAKTAGGNFPVADTERRLAATAMRLSEREREVCARTIAGIGAEGTALDLGISVATVLTYRRRAYRRANVLNALQLAALVMH